MDDEKQPEPVTEKDPPEKPSISEGVSNLIGSIAATVKDVASVVTDHIKEPPSISNRIETGVPPVEENLDAPPMTADEIAENVAADVQPVATAKRAKRKKTVAAKKAPPKKATKRAKKSSKKTVAKKAAKKSVKKAAKKFAKKSVKKAAKKKRKSKK